MAAPREYLPAVTEGVTRPEELPAPQVLPRSRDFPCRSCPRCGHSVYRLRTATRRLHDLGDPLLGRPRVLAAAVRLVVEDGLLYRSASWHLWRDHRVFVPFATIQNWVEAAGEKR
jgi:hypothetical protein